MQARHPRTQGSQNGDRHQIEVASFLRSFRWALAWRRAAASTVPCQALVALGTRCRFAPLFLIAWFADDQDRPVCIGRQYYVGARYRFVL